ncbi:MAG: polymerase sigma factor [Herbinix sp.]|nr:polymerase sigma factor [Herbinix sp.]
MLAVLLMIEDDKDRDKLEELYKTYRKELYYVAYQILHDYHDAEDVLQTAFIKISKHLDKIGEIRCKKTRGYLVIIVRNLSYDRFNEKKKAIPIDFTDEMAEEADNETSLEDYVLNLERGRELAEALSKINSGYADLLTLKYYYDYSTSDIADMVNLSYDVVSVRLTRARAALKRILSKGGNMYEEKSESGSGV